ncbi:MAG: hypothetical protein Q4C58_06180 [Eubacteriales bacterium]|nr:hypothetical protein [Eubacteriales bacterium]
MRNESVFREKSLERISSPEEIGDYMKVTTPGMWLVMAAILLLLAAALIWSVTGRIESAVVVDGQEMTESIAPITFLIE